MEIRHICLGLVAGMVIGGLLRWDKPSEKSTVAASQPESRAITFLGSVPDLGNAPPPPPVEEVLSSDDSEFYENLVLRVAVSEVPDLEILLTALKEQDRLSTTAKDLIFLRWMEIDPASGLRAARSAKVLRSAYWAWAKVDSETAMAFAREETESMPMEAVVRAVGQSDPERAIELVGELEDPRNRSVWEGILDGFGDENPERAAKEAARQGRSDRDYIKAWVNRDPERALAWLSEHQGHEEREFVYAIEQLLKFHPKKAPRIIDSLPEGHPRNLALVSYASHLIHEDADAAFELLVREPSSVRDHAFGEMAGNLVHSDPEAALEILAQIEWANPPPNMNRYEIYRPNGRGTTHSETSESPVNALTRLVESGHPGAVEFLENLPTSARSQKAYSTIMRQWLERDSMAAGDWLNEQPSSPLKDSGISSMTSWLIYEEPPDFDSAARWALVIEDSDTKTNQLYQVFSRWQNIDPVEMQSALQLPGIPETIIDRYQSEDGRTQ